MYEIQVFCVNLDLYQQQDNLKLFLQLWQIWGDFDFKKLFACHYNIIRLK